MVSIGPQAYTGGSTGKFAVEIGGAAVTIPGVYTVPDKSALVAPRGVPSRAMAIVASARGGVVGGITRVLASDEGRVLRGGVGAQMARAAFNQGMSEVFFVRVDQATSAYGNLGTHDLVAINPGAGSKAYQYKVSTSSKRADAVDVFVKDASGNYQPEEYRTLGPVLDLAYIGSGSNPSVAVGIGTDGEMVLSFAATNDPLASMQLGSNAVATVRDMVESINRSATWTARAICQASAPIVVIQAQSVTFSAGRATLYSGGALLSLLMAGSAIAFVATRDSGVVQGDGPAGLRKTTGYEFFAGGNDGPVPTVLDTINALKLLENIEIVGLAVEATNSAAVAAVHSHVTAMSGVKARKERFAAVATGAGITKADFFAASTELALTYSDSERMVVAGNIPLDYDVQTGRLLEQPACVAGAAAIAIKVSSRPEEPLTAKRLKFPKLRFQWSTEELEELIEAGVMPMAEDGEGGGNVIVQGLTTYTVDANVGSRKLAAVDAVDYLDKRIRARLKPITVGRLLDQTTLNKMRSEVVQVLDSEIRSQRNPNGVLTAGVSELGVPEPAWLNLTVVSDGFDLVGADYDAHLVGEIAYVRVRPRFTPVRVSAAQ